MKVQIRDCELVDVEELLSNIQELLSRVLRTSLLTITLLLSSFSFTVFTFANNFNVLICIIEYDGACVQHIKDPNFIPRDNKRMRRITVLIKRNSHKKMPHK